MTALTELRSLAKSRRRDLDRQSGQAKAIVVRARHLDAEVTGLQAEVARLERVAGVLNSIGEERQESAQRQIEALVTRGLQTIFGTELSFHLVTEVKGKAAVTDFIVRTTFADGSHLDTPVMDARGGGLASVVGFLLRLVVMLLSEHGRRLLILDETFAALSAEYEPRLAEFIRELVDRTNVQIILVTHSDAFSDHADKLFRLAIDSRGRSKVVTT